MRVYDATLTEFANIRQLGAIESGARTSRCPCVVVARGSAQASRRSGTSLGADLIGRVRSRVTADRPGESTPESSLHAASAPAAGHPTALRRCEKPSINTATVPVLYVVRTLVRRRGV